jgi:uncharacterized protein YutE (UPF0331/DUF86 family)
VTDRAPVTADARRKAVNQSLAQLARTMEQLEAAVAPFSPNFDLVAFSAAWYSSAPDERNRAMLVRSNMDDLCNLCQALIDRSIRLAQDLSAIPADRKTPPADQLRGLGLYPEDAERTMQEVIRLRNSSQHEYWTLAPEDVHRAVVELRQHIPSFIAALGAWIDQRRPVSPGSPSRA